MGESIDVPVGRIHSMPEKFTILVTGGASGIGLAQVQKFLREGHRVFAADMRDKDNQLPQLLKKYPDNFGYIISDVSNPESVNLLFKEFQRTFESLHVLCNTAGMLDEYKALGETTFEDWNRIIQNNLNSVFLVTKEALPLLLKNKSSRIINMASIAGLTAGGGGISYTAAKHAITGMTKQMAYDYGTQGLRVNAIAPGAVATPMNAADFTENGGKMARWVSEEPPVKRWAAPVEVAELTYFLAGNEADYIQGTVIPVDGGWMIR